MTKNNIITLIAIGAVTLLVIATTIWLVVSGNAN
jgi:hypothetical protein